MGLFGSAEFLRLKTMRAVRDTQIIKKEVTGTEREYFFFYTVVLRTFL
jgi:hypothetical protein